MVNKEQALKITVKVLKMFEGCSLVAYPDPASALYKALSANNLLRKWMKGEVVFNTLPKDLQKLSGKPWTLGYGETQYVEKDDTCTQEEADKVLEFRVEEFMEAVIKVCPILLQQPPERLAACTSLAYNIGKDAFAKSTLARKINEESWQCAADNFLKWVYAGGVVMEGLVKRAKVQHDLFISQGAIK